MAFEKLKYYYRCIMDDVRGNVAPIFGVAAIPLMFSVGAAIDYSRYSRGFNSLVSAGDIAIFAASKKMTGSGEQDNTILKAELEAEFDKFMAANFEADKFKIDYSRKLTFDREDQTMSVEIEGTQQTAFLRALNAFERFDGLKTLHFSTTLGTRLETTPENYVMDIVMCIDATGSMQNTLTSVQANASTFDAQLRDELNIDQDDERFKVRIRPIYFRDYTDITTSSSGHYEYTEEWVYGWYRSGWRWRHGWHWERRRTWVPDPVTSDIEDGLKPAGDFFDLDDNTQTTQFQTFLNSEYAHGGGDAPEAAGACLNEAMRSDWYDRDETEDFPGDENVTVFPIIVTWTDNSIQSLNLTQQYLSPTQPTSYSSFETQWENEEILPQAPKLMILFGPETWSGWSTIRNWDNYEHGGSISTGNSQAISVIADNIIKALPDVLRLTN